jgi:hypothetical protein
MSKASNAAMEALHGVLASTFKDILENGEAVVDKETGELTRITPGAATLNAIRQFLKDNKIEAANGTNKDMNAIARMHLPFQSENDEYGLPQ